MIHDEIYEYIKNGFEESAMSISKESLTPVIILKNDPENLGKIFSALKSNSNFLFDYLMCMSGIDDGRYFSVVYHMYSFFWGHAITIKVQLDGDNPATISVSGIWRAANWYEREIFDMFGIQFDDHPDMRRLLCPHDWVGHPLRKNYVPQEMYHGMRVSYPGEQNAGK